MATLLGHPPFQPGPELGAQPDEEVVLHNGPLLLNGGLQGIDVWVGDGTGFGLDIAPHGVVQWVAVGAGGWPQVVRPESHKVVLAPLLLGFDLVARSGVLLENVVAVGEGGIQPRLNDLFHDLLVLLGANLEARGEPVRRHSHAIGGQDSQHHGRGTELRLVDGGDLLNAIGHKPVVLGVASPVFLSKKNQDCSIGRQGDQTRIAFWPPSQKLLGQFSMFMACLKGYIRNFHVLKLCNLPLRIECTRAI